MGEARQQVSPAGTGNQGGGNTAKGGSGTRKVSRVVFLGPPGAGKGTQALRLAAERKLLHLSTGDMLRAERAAKTPLGIKAEGFMNAGKLVPDDLIIDMLLERLRKPDASGGFILDGFPRTLGQAEALTRRLGAVGSALDRVISFEVAEQVVVDRLAGRLTCGKCAAVYNEKTSPPRQAGVCDRCASPLAVRPDDRPEAVRNRMKVYQEQTAPLVGYYDGLKLLTRVDAGREPEAVFKDLLRIVS